jgi:two-component system, cell cycle sensor histidine kinase and response regulator CckA
LTGVLVLVVSLVATAAWAQNAREPLDLPSSGWTTTGTGLVPFSASDTPGGAGLNLDDTGWQGLRLPGLWHRSLETTPDAGWYRIHLRANREPGTGHAVLLPPIYGAWVAYLNGRRIGGSGRLGDTSAPSEERSHLLDLSWLEEGDNVLAIQAERFGAWGGIGGPIRVGSRASLSRHARLRELLSAGVWMLFLGLFAFQASLFGASPRDPAPLWFGLTALAGALYILGAYDFYYLLMEDTEFKLRIKVLGLYGAHAAGIIYAAFLLKAPERVEAWGLVGAGVLGMAVAAVGSVGVVQLVSGAVWVLTFATLAWTLWLAGRLPVRSPFVRTGARAGMVGLMLALGYDVWAGALEVRGAGAFEYAFVPFAATLVVALAIEHTVVREGAARVLSADRDGLIVTDHFGVVSLVNPAMCSLLGRSIDEIRGVAITTRLLGASRPAVLETIRRLAAARGADVLETYEVSLDTPLGPVHAEFQATCLDEERTLLSFRDLSDRRRLEAEVARAQRLDSLGMLAGGIAHDFNNLLAGILVSAGEIEREAEQEFGEADERVVAIAEEARRGGALTERLLQFARGRTTQPVGVDLETVVPDMLDLLARTLGRNIEWTIEMVASETTAGIDEGELEQILVNLCVNARDSMAPQGGEVVVRIEDGATEDEVVLVVRDAGTGIPPELLDRIYEPFVTTKGSGSGTGLGLAVVHGIVRRRGGEIEIRSEVGRGTEVRVHLPVMEGETTESVTIAVAEIPQSAAKAVRVLLVDDEETLRTFLATALERRGFVVTAVDGGRSVIKWLSEQGDAPPVDIVVMDMMMPGIDGREATQALRQRWAGLPVVISSGYTGRDDISELSETGPTEVLRKPYRADDLMKMLLQLLAEEAAGVTPRTETSAAL